MITTILFDLDGTLVDSVAWHEEALNLALEDVSGFRIKDWENRELFSGKLTKDKLAILTAQGRLDIDDRSVIVHKKQEHLHRILQNNKGVSSDKEELFSKIKHLNLACVTNSNRKAAEEVLTAIGLYSYFSFIITGDEIRHPKPSAEGYVLAMLRFSSSPSKTLIVEDSPLGLQAARSTGSYVWAVKNPEEVTWNNFQKILMELQ